MKDKGVMMKKRCMFIILGALFFLLTAQAQSGLQKPPVITGGLLVRFRPGVAAETVARILKATGLQQQRQLRDGRTLLLSSAQDGLKTAHRLALMPEVEAAEAEAWLMPAEAVNDPLYAAQWHLQTIGAPAAWENTTGSPQIIIAICDTGIDASQPDLVANLVQGWNVVDNNGDTSPVHPHGTWVAGCAAAVGGNGIGVAAPAMHCKLMPVRVSSNPNGAASTSSIVDAICWAADHGARVINLSYSGFGSPAISSAAAYAVSRGAVFVMAAGNSGNYQTIADDPNIITVGATTSTDTLATISSYGSFVDLTAPGQGILTTGTGSTYPTVTGTSFASPLVAAVAALVLSIDPTATPRQVADLLRVTADDLGADGWDDHFGYGRLNAGRAVAAAAAARTGDPDIIIPRARFLFVEQTLLAGVSPAERIAVEAIDDRRVEVAYLIVDGQAIDFRSGPPFNFEWDTSAETPGAVHEVTVLAKDEAGLWSRTSKTATIIAGYDATPPTVSILQPVAKERVQGEAVVMVAAADNSGLITYVELYVDGEFAAFSNQVPYTIHWSAAGLANGLHTITCRAYDWAGNFGDSAPVVVVVK